MNDILIRQAFAGIGPPPGAEDRIRQRLETVLGEPLRARSVTVRPRVNPLPKLLAAAAMLTVVVGGTALILWPLLRPIFLPDGPELLTEIEEPADGTPAPTEEAEPVEEAPEEPEPSEPTADPALVLGPIVDEGTVTLEDGRSLTWAVDQKGLLRIRGEGDMADFCGNYHWQTNWQDQLPWQGYLTSVQTVVIEPGLTTIAPRAFSDFRSLTDLLLPDSLETIGDNAFYSCAKLKDVTIPDRVETIGDYAFFDCNSLRRMQLPQGLRSIGTKAFSSCGLEELTIPGSVTAMGDFAFSYCNSLKSVTLEDGLTAVGAYAFYCCDLLRSVTVPVSVKEIGRGAFSRFSKWTDLTVGYAGSEEQWQRITIDEGNDWLNTAAIRFESTAEDAATDVQTETDYALSTVVDEGTAAGENGSTLSWTLDSKGLLLIRGEGDMEDFYPFVILKRYDPSAGRLVEESKPAYPWTNHLSSIRTVLIEPGLSSIGDNAFSNAGTLIRVQIPETVTRIGSAAFSNCGLESVTIPEGVTSIGEYAFSNCSSMRSISISDTVTSIGEWAFYLAGLESVTIPGSVEVIEDNAFNNCRSLKSVTIQDGVREIRMNAFYYCNNLAELSIPGSVTKIGFGVFYWCNSLESVVIPEGVTEIQNGCFSNCNALKTIWLPASLSMVSYSQFEHCVSLSDIYYAGSEEQWDQIMESLSKGLLDYATIHFNSEP